MSNGDQTNIYCRSDAAFHCAGQEKIGFYVPLVHMKIRLGLGIQAILALGSGSGVSSLNGRVLVVCSGVKTPPEQANPHTYGGKSHGKAHCI